ncbi:MAG: alpha-L-fucosidase [Clostridia bacterium]|nr:alpha-L-fucosidase [Clostridia bacterium]
MNGGTLQPRAYVRDFENLGFGMFVHFGLYSQREQGEWTMYLHNIPRETYARLADTFSPAKDWAKRLVKTAKKAGCKYVTLTTRHHDGFSLYDTCGLSDFDAPSTACGRDLVQEFVDACNAEGLVPFFYHTLLDWRQESYKTDFKAYLVYLRKSIEILCKNYGKIGGFWFDGMWDKPNDDWEEDALYGTIRTYQKDAMIVNNTGLNAQGALGHIELDSVTFERGKPAPINQKGAPRYVASEVCQTLNTHWGYAKNDYYYTSLANVIEDWCICRKFGSNFLLNVGPKANGYLRDMDKALLKTLGSWTAISKKAMYLPKPCDLAVQYKEKDFVLRGKNAYYLFCFDLSMLADPNVERTRANAYEDTLTFPEKVEKITWLDEPKTELAFVQDGDTLTVKTGPYPYGKNLVVRIAEIKTK